MGFETFGKVSFTSETKAAAFVDYLAQGKVMGTRCKACGTAYFPPKMDCPSCPDSETEWVEITGPGKLIAYSTVHYGPAGFEDDAPYTIAVGEFGNGLHIFSRISKDIKVEEIKPGMKLKVVPIKLTGDRLSYEFQKA
ncbi:MAG: Zn-ribbon domain-containing OB-fold protein [Chloroflexi bacterium]|nr:Zn-ribbon domain-containing OB-fold protein [Chloroflexota bacterium]